MSSTAHPVMKVTVQQRVEEAQDICTLRLTPATSDPLPDFSAGSHIDVTGPTGLVRQYSLCNEAQGRGHYLIAIQRDPQSRGGSRALFDQVQVGDTLEISAPKNHFPLAHDARHSLLFAGGIGITPLLCMAERLSQVGAPFTLHYAVRTLARAAFLARLRQAPFASRVQVYCDDGAETQRFQATAAVPAPADGVHLYVCGPAGFMNLVLETARAKGWPDSQLHCEYFAGEVADTSGDQDFEVQVASTGQVIPVTRDQTVVQALADAGVEVSVSCEQGVCGTCVTRVLSGTPEHRDMFLSPKEQQANDQFLPCCSRAKSPRLVLDL